MVVLAPALRRTEIRVRAGLRDGDKMKTRDEILNMPAGREMDELVATRVMGWDVHPHATHYIRNDGKNVYFVICGEFEPSSDIAAAWQVVEKMTDGETPNDCEIHTTVRGWRCDFYRGSATAETAPLAICRAALIAALERTA
jgi:O-glycosyl hydrolase